MSLSSLLDYFGEQQSLSAAPEIAKQFNDPFIQNIAENDPRAFRSMLPGLIDARNKQLQEEQKRRQQVIQDQQLQGMLSAAMGQPQQVTSQALPEIQPYGQQQAGTAQPSALASIAQSNDQASSILPSNAQERLFAAINPAGYAKWINENKPELVQKQEARQKEANDATSGFLDLMANYQNLLGTTEDSGKIEKAKSLPNWWNTGMTGKIQSLVGASSRANLEGALTTVGANEVLKTMERLKELSKQGATGFGATNEKEIEIMRDKIASLNPNQDPETIRQNLDDLKKFSDKQREREVDSYIKSMKKIGIQPQIAAKKDKDGNVVQRVMKVNDQWIRIQ